jgi:iron-sulfur cluster repair protein YtfE (RIC family)
MRFKLNKKIKGRSRDNHSSLAKLSEELLTMRKDMTSMSVMMREELTEFKRILLGPNSTTECTIIR